MASSDSAVVGSEVAVPGPAAELSGPVHDPAWDDPERFEPRPLTPDERMAFVQYVKDHKGCSVREACKAVDVRRVDVRALLKSDIEFGEDYRTARGYGQEQILNTMVEEALVGVEEFVVSAGKIVAYPEGHERAGDLVTVRRRSERLIQTMFNGLTPEGKSMLAGKLGIEISGPDGGPIQVQQGVSLESVARVLLDAGVDLEELAGRRVAGEIEAGELVDETDEPA
jgi:hypothetical protein